jgi:hypothetical protein
MLEVKKMEKEFIGKSSSESKVAEKAPKIQDVKIEAATSVVESVVLSKDFSEASETRLDDGSSDSDEVPSDATPSSSMKAVQDISILGYQSSMHMVKSKNQTNNKKRTKAPSGKPLTKGKTIILFLICRIGRVHHNHGIPHHHP